MRHEKGLHTVNKVAEQTLFMIGDARDFLHTAERQILKVIEDLVADRITFSEAQIKIVLIFSAAHKDLNDWTKQFASDVQEAGFPYLHNDLKVARVIQLLPTGPEDQSA